MAEVLVFHHALGLTAGVRSFADELRAAGHEVRTPDLFDGKDSTDLSDGVGFAKEIGFSERARAAADGLPNEVAPLRTGCRTSSCTRGFSLGVMPARMLAQTRPGAEGALLLSS